MHRFSIRGVRQVRRLGITAALMAMVALALALPGTALASGSATTGPAAAITASGATLTGEVAGADTDSVYAFQYGTTTAYGKVTPAKVATNGAVSATVAGLAANTAYHYRLVLVDAASDPPSAAAGSDASFTTHPAFKASAITGKATGVTATSATVHAKINLPIAGAYKIQYGPSAAYGKVTATTTVTAGRHSISIKLTGLKKHTSYHFRVVVTDSPAGVPSTTNGAGHTFRTKK